MMNFLNSLFIYLHIPPEIGVPVLSSATLLVGILVLVAFLTRRRKKDAFDASFLDQVHDQLSPDEMKRVRTAFLRRIEEERERKATPPATVSDLSRMVQQGALPPGASSVKRIATPPASPRSPLVALPQQRPVVVPPPPVVVTEPIEEDFPMDPDFLDSDFQDPNFPPVERPVEKAPLTYWGMEKKPEDADALPVAPPESPNFGTGTMVDVDVLYQRGLIGEEEYRKIKEMFPSN